MLGKNRLFQLQEPLEEAEERYSTASLRATVKLQRAAVHKIHTCAREIVEKQVEIASGYMLDARRSVKCIKGKINVSALMKMSSTTVYLSVHLQFTRMWRFPEIEPR